MLMFLLLERESERDDWYMLYHIVSILFVQNINKNICMGVLYSTIES